jgi:DNA-directed RNA polymerase specialized sigma24 family protein
MFGFGESHQRELLQAAFRYAFSLTHHQCDAEDLVQSAWLKLLSMNAKVPAKNLLLVTIRNFVFRRVAPAKNSLILRAGRRRTNGLPV